MSSQRLPSVHAGQKNTQTFPEQEHGENEMNEIRERELIARTVQIRELRKKAGVQFAKEVHQLIPDLANSFPECKEWMDNLEPMTRPGLGSQVKVGLYGNMGAGKSELINALIGDEVLVCSTWKASTAVVTEIAYNNEANDYRATIEFISLDDWQKELQFFLRDCKSLDGNEEQNLDQRNLDSASKTTWSKLKSVCPGLDLKIAATFDVTMTTKDAIAKRASDLAQMGTVPQILKRSPAIRHEKLELFRKLLDQYVSASGEAASERNHFRCSVYWPFIKKVAIKTRATVLRKGLVLVDLPGLGDVDAARGSVAENYIMNLDKIWVVADITRAVSDAVARNLLGPSFQRQLRMDGKYNDDFVTLIMTKTDNITNTHLINDPLVEKDERFHELVHGRTEWHTKVKDAKDQVLKIKASLNKFESDLRRLYKEENKLRLKAGLGKRKKDGSVSTRTSKKQKAADGNSRATQSSPHDTANDMDSGSVNDQLHEMEDRREIMLKEQEKCEADRKKAEETLAEYEEKSQEIEILLKKRCIQARNAGAARQAREDFQEGYRELELNLRDAGDEIDGDSAPSRSSIKSLKVFTVSSLAHLKLFDLLQHDNCDTAGFEHPEDSQIPKLQRYCQELTLQPRRIMADRFLNLLEPLTVEMTRWIDNKDINRYNKDTKAGIEKMLTSNMQELELEFSEALDLVGNDFKRLAVDGILPVFDRCTRHAVEKAVQTGKAWAKAPIAWNTRQAICRRNGVFKSSTTITYDWNKKLTEPFFRHLTRLWDTTFNEQLSHLIAQHYQTLQDNINQFSAQVQKSATGHSRTFADSLSLTLTNYAPNYGVLKAAITQDITVLVQERAMELHREVQPKVREGMEEVYQSCTEVHGTGTNARMCKKICDRLELQGDEIYEDVKTMLSNALVQHAKLFVSDMKTEHKKAIEQLRSAVHRPLHSSGRHEKLSDELLTQKAGFQELLKGALSRLQAGWAEDGMAFEDEEAEFHSQAARGPGGPGDLSNNSPDDSSDESEDEDSDVQETPDDVPESPETPRASLTPEIPKGNDEARIKIEPGDREQIRF